MKISLSPSAFFLLVFSFLFTLSALPASEDLETLIEEGKHAAAWESPGDDLPPAFLLGDTTGVLLYSDKTYNGKPSELCQRAAFDEIIEWGGTAFVRGQAPVNVAKPSVQEELESICLVRPGDPILVIGKGSQDWHPIASFEVREEAAPCEDDSPYAFWGVWEKPLAEKPLFFSTDPLLTAGENAYQELSPDRFEGVPDAALLEGVAPVLLYPDEFHIRAFALPGHAEQHLVMAERRRSTVEDEGLIQQALFWRQGTEVSLLWVERVRWRQSTGRFSVAGLLDFNQDGQWDIIVEGQSEQCPYQLLFKGSGEKPELMSMPAPRCRC